MKFMGRERERINMFNFKLCTSAEDFIFVWMNLEVAAPDEAHIRCYVEVTAQDIVVEIKGIVTQDR